jgi:hypothetical protein
MGYALVVLMEAPRASITAEPGTAANASLGAAPVIDQAGVPADTPRGP